MRSNLRDQVMVTRIDVLSCHSTNTKLPSSSRDPRSSTLRHVISLACLLVVSASLPAPVIASETALSSLEVLSNSPPKTYPTAVLTDPAGSVWRFAKKKMTGWASRSNSSSSSSSSMVGSPTTTLLSSSGGDVARTASGAIADDTKAAPAHNANNLRKRRVLLVSIGLHGHAVPLLRLAGELQRRGHEISFGSHDCAKPWAAAEGLSSFVSAGGLMRHMAHDMAWSRRVATAQGAAAVGTWALLKLFSGVYLPLSKPLCDNLLAHYRRPLGAKAKAKSATSTGALPSHKYPKAMREGADHHGVGGGSAAAADGRRPLLPPPDLIVADSLTLGARELAEVLKVPLVLNEPSLVSHLLGCSIAVGGGRSSGSGLPCEELGGGGTSQSWTLETATAAPALSDPKPSPPPPPPFSSPPSMLLTRLTQWCWAAVLPRLASFKLTHSFRVVNAQRAHRGLNPVLSLQELLTPTHAALVLVNSVNEFLLLLPEDHDGPALRSIAAASLHSPSLSPQPSPHTALLVGPLLSRQVHRRSRLETTEKGEPQTEAKHSTNGGVPPILDNWLKGLDLTPTPSSSPSPQTTSSPTKATDALRTKKSRRGGGGGGGGGRGGGSDGGQGAGAESAGVESAQSSSYAGTVLVNLGHLARLDKHQARALVEVLTPMGQPLRPRPPHKGDKREHSHNKSDLGGGDGNGDDDDDGTGDGADTGESLPAGVDPFRVLWVVSPELRAVLPAQSLLPGHIQVKEAGPRFPHLSLLAHPSVKLVLTTCGTAAAQEALAHGKPLACLPLLAGWGGGSGGVGGAGTGAGDQRQVTRMVLRLGVGVALDPNCLQPTATSHTGNSNPTAAAASSPSPLGGGGVTSYCLSCLSGWGLLQLLFWFSASCGRYATALFLRGDSGGSGSGGGINGNDSIVDGYGFDSTDYYGSGNGASLLVGEKGDAHCSLPSASIDKEQAENNNNVNNNDGDGGADPFEALVSQLAAWDSATHLERFGLLFRPSFDFWWSLLTLSVPHQLRGYGQAQSPVRQWLRLWWERGYGRFLTSPPPPPTASPSPTSASPSSSSSSPSSSSSSSSSSPSSSIPRVGSSSNSGGSGSGGGDGRPRVVVDRSFSAADLASRARRSTARELLLTALDRSSRDSVGFACAAKAVALGQVLRKAGGTDAAADGVEKVLRGLEDRRRRKGSADAEGGEEEEGVHGDAQRHFSSRDGDHGDDLDAGLFASALASLAVVFLHFFLSALSTALARFAGALTRASLTVQAVVRAAANAAAAAAAAAAATTSASDSASSSSVPPVNREASSSLFVGGEGGGTNGSASASCSGDIPPPIPPPLSGEQNPSQLSSDHHAVSANSTQDLERAAANASLRPFAAAAVVASVPSPPVARALVGGALGSSNTTSHGGGGSAELRSIEEPAAVASGGDGYPLQ